jgi:transcriptional regulator with XRE-family HTH domain
MSYFTAALTVENMTNNAYNSLGGGIMPDYLGLGQRFSEIRIISGLTQRQLADYLGVDQSYISKCEKNERQFSADAMEKAASLFGCCCEYFLGDQVEPTLMPLKMEAKHVTGSDLDVVATINRLALNLWYMEETLKGGSI